MNKTCSMICAMRWESSSGKTSCLPAEAILPTLACYRALNMRPSTIVDACDITHQLPFFAEVMRTTKFKNGMAWIIRQLMILKSG